MKHLFVPYEIAKIAKEKGFNEPCLAIYSTTKVLSIEQNNPTGEYYFYNSDLLAPLYQQLVDWFRDKHLITIEPFSMLKGVRKATFETVFRVQKWGDPNGYRDSNYTKINKALAEAFKLIP